MTRGSALIAWAVLLGFAAAGSRTAGAADAPAAEGTKKIVFIAGKKSHGPGAHEYEAGLKLFKQCLDASPNAKGIRTELHVNDWPADAATLNDADTIVLFSDGMDKKYKEEQHPMLKDDHLEIFAKQMKRGCGLVVIHWPLWVPSKKGAEELIEWVGGSCCYEKEGPGQGKPPEGRWGDAEKHPVLRGVKPFTWKDEYYGNRRFRENDPRLVPILPVPGKSGSQLWAWAVERADGGRGFAFIGGHTHANWKNDDLRKAMLNAILWTAKVDVPPDGVLSTVDMK